MIRLFPEAAGKTTILYKLKLGEVVTTIPTIGFNAGAPAGDVRSMLWWSPLLWCW